MASRDKATNQLNEFKKAQAKPDVLTTGTGAPVGNKTATLTVGPRGPVLMQDFVFTDEMAHFNRERIPERVVHAKGAGAFGYFECTHDISKYCKAKPFEHVGKKTPLGVRFSTVGGESGSADTARDPRGFAVKMYTEDGNWDLVGNNTPIFFIRDPILFPSFIHTQKRNPQTHLKDPDMFWDFISLRPETTHQVSFLFSDRGTPNGYRHMNGYGSHTFKMVNKDGEAVYCKFHWKVDQGIKNFMADQAAQLATDDPDYAIRDLYNAIAEGNFPSWTLKIQVMTFEEAEKFRYNPFDLTKIWPQGEFPLIPVGRMVLNRNPKNYFTEVEQIAFSPVHMIPGIEASPDKMLQGRLFSYSDTHRHRLGSNYLQIPVNCPYNARVKNYQRDGPQCVDENQGGAPNYFPNSFTGPQEDANALESTFTVSGEVKKYNTADEDNFSQVTVFFNKVLKPDERQRLIENIAGHLINASEFIQKRAVSNFSQVDPEYGGGIQKLMDQMKAKRTAAQGRLFSYSDTHRHRLGSNYLQIPVNCPYNARVKNYQRDGPQCVDENQGGAPNYFPNSFTGPQEDANALESTFTVSGEVKKYNTADEDNFSQVTVFFNKVLKPDERQRLIENIAGHLINASEFIQKRAVSNFSQVDPEYGGGIQKLMDQMKAKRTAAQSGVSAQL